MALKLAKEEQERIKSLRRKTYDAKKDVIISLLEKLGYDVNDIAKLEVQLKNRHLIWTSHQSNPKAKNHPPRKSLPMQRSNP